MCALDQKKRLDSLIVERGLADSRHKAQAILMAGLVTVEGVSVTKPGKMVPTGCEITVKQPPHGYVSRGGEKLRAAIERFDIQVAGKVCIDVGASTGGFTDCLIKHGAKLVYAVDVGYGQLAYQLRDRSDVVVLERTNIRYLQGTQLPEKPELATIDVSFISLRLVLPRVFELLTDNGEVVALAKPQFEVGKDQVGKGGIVKKPELHRQVLEGILSESASIGFYPAGAMSSPLLGAKGNREFLMYVTKQRVSGESDLASMIDNAISEPLPDRSE